MMHMFSRWLWQWLREVLSWAITFGGGLLVYWLWQLPFWTG